MINPSNSSLVENFNLIDNALRRKRKFSDMMNTSICITQGILNNNIHYKNLHEIPESFFFGGDFDNQEFVTKIRKLNNFPSTNDFIYKVDKDFGEMRICKIDGSDNNQVNNEIQLHSESSLDNDCLLNNNSNRNANANSLLGKKSKYEENPSNPLSKCEKDNPKINKNPTNTNNNLINSLNSFDYLIDDEEIIKPNNTLNSNSFKLVNYTKFINKREKESKNNLNKTKIIEDSFNECVIDIDMSDFKNQPNNQNFFNCELTDLDTVNTSRNSNFDDLSLSFLTEYSNKIVSGNIISNAIETEKLMMKLFDICNPALQPTEK